MKSIKYLVAGLIAMGLVASSHATITVNWGSAANTFMSDNTGAANYLGSDLLEIGTFTNAPSGASLADFVVFGTTTTGSGGLAGTFAQQTVATAGTTFGGAQIYLVAFNGATTGASQRGIFFVNDAINARWMFPNDTDTISSKTIDVQDMFTGTTATLASGATIVFGSKGLDGSGPYNLLETAPVVPEPSTWALVGTGLLGMIGLIRRRRS